MLENLNKLANEANSREELFRKIAKDMLDNNMLNEQNYVEINDLLNDVVKLLEKRFADYNLLQGTII